MTKEEIIKMAQKADAGFEVSQFHEESIIGMNAIERFAKLVASAERERILDMCKEGLWDAEGIRYHLDNQNRGQA